MADPLTRNVYLLGCSGTPHIHKCTVGEAYCDMILLGLTPSDCFRTFDSPSDLCFDVKPSLGLFGTSCNCVPLNPDQFIKVASRRGMRYPITTFCTGNPKEIEILEKAGFVPVDF
jgi:hypothetical protein